MFEAIRPVFHLILHVVVPAIVAKWITAKPQDDSTTKSITAKPVAFTGSWRQAFTVMMLTMIVDADHLLADPIYEAGRCSINFHPLHTAPAIVIFILLCFPAKTRVIGIGLVIHMILDGLDCWMMK